MLVDSSHALLRYQLHYLNDLIRNFGNKKLHNLVVDPLLHEFPWDQPHHLDGLFQNWIQLAHHVPGIFIGRLINRSFFDVGRCEVILRDVNAPAAAIRDCKRPHVTRVVLPFSAQTGHHPTLHQSFCSLLVLFTSPNDLRQY